MKSFLLIGGTGIVGSATALEAQKRGFQVVALGLKKNLELPLAINQIVTDRNDKERYLHTLSELTKKYGRWDIVFDVIASKERDAQQTCDLLKGKADRFFFLSTTLVYSRKAEDFEPIPSCHPLAEKGELGGYVDCKVGMEEYLKLRKDIPYTILRPCHILGRWSLLGCLPDHNRDPFLLDKLRKGDPLELCHGGNIPLNITHPRDIAHVVVESSKKDQMIQRVYNCVNPTEVLAREYYEEVCRQIGGTLLIKTKTYAEVWNEQKGWELTSLPHRYDVGDLKRDLGFIPGIPYQECIKDALSLSQQEYKDLADIPVHNRMTLLPRPRMIPWLIKYDQTHRST